MDLRRIELSDFFACRSPNYPGCDIVCTCVGPCRQVRHRVVDQTNIYDHLHDLYRIIICLTARRHGYHRPIEDLMFRI